jgi:predicted ArsR family transcriptional regulator
MTTNRKRPRTDAATATQSEAPPSTKSARLLAMLGAPDGASIEEISEALSWQQHSTRAALTGLRKKGHAIIRDKQGSVTTYRIAQ